MATPRTNWDPRSEQAAESVERMVEDWEPEGWATRTLRAMGVGQEPSVVMEAVEEGPEPRGIIILACGHWEWNPVSIDRLIESDNGQRTVYCIRHRQAHRVLAEVNLDA